MTRRALRPQATVATPSSFEFDTFWSVISFLISTSYRCIYIIYAKTSDKSIAYFYAWNLPPINVITIAISFAQED